MVLLSNEKRLFFVALIAVSIEANSHNNDTNCVHVLLKINKKQASEPQLQTNIGDKTKRLLINDCSCFIFYQDPRDIQQEKKEMNIEHKFFSRYFLIVILRLDHLQLSKYLEDFHSMFSSITFDLFKWNGAELAIIHFRVLERIIILKLTIISTRELWSFLMHNTKI